MSEEEVCASNSSVEGEAGLVRRPKQLDTALWDIYGAVGEAITLSHPAVGADSHPFPVTIHTIVRSYPIRAPLDDC